MRDTDIAKYSNNSGYVLVVFKLIYAEKNPGPRFRLYSRELIGNLATREPDDEKGNI